MDWFPVATMVQKSSIRKMSPAVPGMGEDRDKPDNIIQAPYLHPMGASRLSQPEDSLLRISSQLRANSKLTVPDHHLNLAEKKGSCISKPHHHD